ncbi:Ca2+-binding RTX toxin-like protein [Nitrosomonas ureae]|uniref:DUF4347 domain-containing protein n=1 Tax=Nitrosomonas ureae TaxID=44577 RepID=UPI000D764044|nr:DUF4347 domain-containing protein [Nitrosomonas ureae]PXX14766.1 Ca2+-binding RTX toxin-like protein [Nitrosomonas ureae]
MPNRIVFIDSNIAEYQTLIPQIARNSEIFILNVKRDGVLQILEALKNTTDLQAIDIISHGKPGALMLGNGELSASNLEDYAHHLTQIGSHLSPNGDILLYGCEVAQGKVGQRFIEDLARLTGANVAASRNMTGSTKKDCEWMLEAQVGNIQTSTFQLSYPGVLGNYIGTPGNDELVGGVDDDLFTGGAGNDILIGGSGNDIAIYSGNQADYEFSINSSGQIIVHDINLANGDEGEDTLSGIETFRFANGDVQNSKEFYEFRVNTNTLNDQGLASITSLKDGGFLITWAGENHVGKSIGIFGQRFNFNGVAQGNEFQINSTIREFQDISESTALPNGGYVVTWTAGDGYSDVYAQRYGASGTAQGNEFIVNSTTIDDQYFSSISTLSNGGYVIVWTSFIPNSNSSLDIYAQLYDVNGAALGSEFRVNATISQAQDRPSVTALSNGDFVVTWMSSLQDGSMYGIYGQRYDVNGVIKGNEFRVNTTTIKNQSSPSIMTLKDEGFIVTWTSDHTGDIDIYAQRYDINGNTRGNEFRVNTTTTGAQFGGEITDLNNGDFIVTWTSNHNGNSDVYAQLYDINGIAQGSEFLVNISTANSQVSSDITGLDDGGFVVGWSSNHNGDSDVYAQRYDIYGEPVGGLTLVGSSIDDQISVAASSIFSSKLSGMAGSDFLQGGLGNDILDGGADNDTLNGKFGIDTMIGGLGNDRYLVDNLTDIVIEKSNEGIDDVISSVTFALSPNVENLTLTGILAINGTGNDQANVINGSAGANRLNGGAGSDMLIGDIGNDILSGDSGADTMIGGLGDDNYLIENINDVVTENSDEGLDNISSTVTYALSSNVENLILTGTLSINGTGNDLPNEITGNSAINQLKGGDGNDLIKGEGGNDSLNGDTGADTLIGGLGDDSYFVDNINDVITEQLNEGLDTLSSAVTFALAENVENLILTGAQPINGIGNDKANTITGNSAVNRLNGAAGNDIIIGGLGADIMIGGLGNDSYIVENSGDVITENLNGGVDNVSSSVNYALSDFIEELTLTGTSPINGTGNAQANTIIGNSAANKLKGAAGNDILNGVLGADTMTGGLGNDNYIVDNVGDKIVENLNGNFDSVSSSVTYTLSAYIEELTLKGTSAINGTGNLQANTIVGNTAANQLNGNGGNDILNGGLGVDTLIGGLGNDTFIVDNINDAVIELLNQGTDTVNSSVSHTLRSNVENLSLLDIGLLINGNGNNQANILIGNSFNNILDGKSGNDTLDGDLGNNVLTGGLGNDIFRFTTKNHVDTITDYNVANDTIHLENSVFTSLTNVGTLAANQLRVGTKALDANDYIIYNKTTGMLSYDSDGNGATAAIQIATIGTGLALTNADIVVI